MSGPIHRAALQRGQGLLEYGLVLGLIALVVIGILVQLGKQANSAYCGVAQGLNGLSYGSLQAWGLNTNGQLGNPNASNPQAVPVAVQNLSTCVFSVVSGAGATAAVGGDGTVWTWGNNGNDQLGIGSGSPATSSTPMQVVDVGGSGHLSNVASVAAGQRHFVALKTDGTVWAWGDNTSGQLGPGGPGGLSPSGASPSPVQVTGLTGSVVAVATGDSDSYAILSNGNVYAWGSNTYGQLGLPSCGCALTSTPSFVVDGTGGLGSKLGNVVQISGRAGNVMALLKDGTIWVWGRNDMGQLANNTYCNVSPCGVAIPSQAQAGACSLCGSYLTGITSVTTAEYSDYALRSDGTLWAWGQNQYAQLGIGTTAGPATCSSAIACSTLPVQVVGTGGVGTTLTNVTVVAANSAGGYAIASGTLYAWGQDPNGEIGNNTVAGGVCTCVTAPTTVSISGKVLRIAAGFNIGFAIVAR